MAAFRGITAPASLKAGGTPYGLFRVQTFPGHYCPGLIEGRSSPSPAPGSAGLSGALLPRPH